MKSRLAPTEDRILPLAVAGEYLGVSGDAIRKREAPRGVEKLTIIDLSNEHAGRRTLGCWYAEVIALRDELYQNARQRTDVDRMQRTRGHLHDVSKAVNG